MDDFSSTGTTTSGTITFVGGNDCNFESAARLKA
jgi:hypothetical protein